MRAVEQRSTAGVPGSVVCERNRKKWRGVRSVDLSWVQRRCLRPCVSEEGNGERTSVEEAKDQPASDKIGFPFLNLFYL